MNPNHDDHGRFAAGGSSGGGGAAAHEGVRSTAALVRQYVPTHRQSPAEQSGRQGYAPSGARITHPGGNTRPVSAPGPAKSGLSLNATRGSLWGGK